MINQFPKNVLPCPGKDVFALNVILRSALFSVFDASSEPEEITNEIFSAPDGWNITFTGKRLYQNDLDKWLGITRLIALDKGYTFTPKSKKSCLETLGFSDSGQSAKAFDISMEKLTTSKIVIRNKEQVVIYAGHLLYKCKLDDRRCTYGISPEMSAIYSPGKWSRIDWAVRKKLRNHPLAAWLHCYYSTHKNSQIPTGVETLQKLCGSRNLCTKSFKQKLGKAASRIREACNENGREFEWEIKGKNFHVTHTLGRKKPS
jgi:hypothetical protein